MSLDGQSPHILIVNDQPDILLLKQEILEEEGFRVTMRVTSDISVYEVLGLSPDVIILGYGSEAELELLRSLSGETCLTRVPLVLCTGAVREVEAIKPELEARGIAVVYKPFDIDYLVQVVRQQLGLGSSSGETFPPTG